jgi:hypothetical protein
MSSLVLPRTLLAVVLQLTCIPIFATTWYVRPDGGTRSQCDGKSDSAFASRGSHRHCAFNDVRYLYMDGSHADGTKFPAWGWVIAGGDTVIIRGSIGTGASYRIGMQDGQTNNWVGGIWGNPYGSGMPPPPSGTATQHTRILGENYAACTTRSAKTQLHGGYGVSSVVNLSGSSYVDVACLDIADFSDCGRASQTKKCVTGGAQMSDYAQNGIKFTNTSTHDTLTDMSIHGLASFGMYGPTGTGTVINRISIFGNAAGGWNADLSNGTTGIGTLDVSNFNISWNGCAEEYPIVDPLPYNDCTDDSSGGYGDGFGTATVASPAPGWQVHFDQGIVSYNTQDGLDALHIKGPGSTMTVTRTLAYGNEGNQIKVGGSTATVINSVIVGNCEAMKTEKIPGAPTGFGSKLRDPCRAGNVAVVLETTPGDPATYEFNTLYSRGSIGLEVEYATDDHGSGNTLTYDNNIFVGFHNNSSGSNPAAIYSSTDLKMLANPGASWANNVTFGQKAGIPCPRHGEHDAICSNPGLIDETYHAYGYGNMAPKPSGSAVRGAAIVIPKVATDFAGQTRKERPSIGAYE